MSTDDQMSIEDRVRAATRAGASLISDVRPLDAPAPVRLRRRPRPAPRRWASWGVPLAAAAAVAAIALTLVAVRQAGPPSPASSGSGTAAPTAIPRYYVEPTYDNHAQRSGPLILGDDVTGKVIATIAPPSGLEFNYAVGTSEDGTFVVQSSAPTPYGSPPYSWSLLRVTPGGARPYQLTRLPVRLLGDQTYARAFAVSPDGRELAVESDPGTPKAKPVVTVGVYSVSTGARLRAWTAPTSSVVTDFTGRSLSWLDDGRLVFSAAPAPAHLLQLRALDVTGAGTDLLAGSKALFTVGNSSTCASLRITPDGGTGICATSVGSPGNAGGAGCAHVGPRLTAFPLPGGHSGQPVRTLYLYPGPCHDGTAVTLWTDASASSVIIATTVNTASKGTKEAFQVGVVTGGRWRPINIAKSVPPVYYADLAF